MMMFDDLNGIHKQFSDPCPSHGKEVEHRSMRQGGCGTGGVRRTSQPRAPTDEKDERVPAERPLLSHTGGKATW
jgi:hypothetical protein